MYLKRWCPDPTCLHAVPLALFIPGPPPAFTSLGGSLKSKLSPTCGCKPFVDEPCSHCLQLFDTAKLEEGKAWSRPQTPPSYPKVHVGSAETRKGAGRSWSKAATPSASWWSMCAGHCRWVTRLTPYLGPFEGFFKWAWVRGYYKIYNLQALWELIQNQFSQIKSLLFAGFLSYLCTFLS